MPSPSAAPLHPHPILASLASRATLDCPAGLATLVRALSRSPSPPPRAPSKSPKPEPDTVVGGINTLSQRGAQSADSRHKAVWEGQRARSKQRRLGSPHPSSNPYPKPKPKPNPAQSEMQGPQPAMLVHLVMVVSTVMSMPSALTHSTGRPVRCGHSHARCSDEAAGLRDPNELHEVRACPRILPLGLACTVITAPLFAARCAVAQIPRYHPGP